MYCWDKLLISARQKRMALKYIQKARVNNLKLAHKVM